MSQIINNYAAALYELAVGDENIKKAQKAVLASPELMRVLESPLTSFRKKEAVIERIFPAETAVFLKIVCKNGRAVLLPEIFKAYEALKNSRERKLTAKLYYVTPPSQTQLEKIKNFLKTEYGASAVEIDMTQDKSLIGGFVLAAGGCEYDYSMKGRFARLEQRLIRR